MVSALSSVLLALALASCPNKEFGQCGGKGWSGSTCCPDYDKCTNVNEYYSQCEPLNLCLNVMYGQCGGMDHHQPPRPWTPANHHPTCCPSSFECVYQTKYFSQCQYNATNTTCAGAFKQCGGAGWTGKTCCVPGFKCKADNKYYSGCAPIPICPNARYGQCGGLDGDGKPWTPANGHSTCCPEDFECTYTSQYFSQCKPNVTAIASPQLVEGVQ